MKRVSLVAAFREGLLLMGRRRDNSRWTLPGGGLEEGEEPEAGARRELLEETGLEPEGELVLVDERVLGDITLYTFECEVSGVPSGAADPDQEVDLWAFFDIDDGIPKAVAEHMVGPKDPDDNVAADLYGLAKAEDALAKMALIHHDAVKPMTIYRIQNTAGEGPYGRNAPTAVVVAGRNHYIAAQKRGQENPQPNPPVDFPDNDMKEFRAVSDYDENYEPTNPYRFGFEKPEHAESWFGQHALDVMKQHGYTLQQVPAQKVYRSNSGKQVFFLPHNGLAKAQQDDDEIVVGSGVATGQPASLTYHHSRSSIPTAHYGERFGQHVEPSGQYMGYHGPSWPQMENHIGQPRSATGSTWHEYGTVHFKNPLVVEGENTCDWKEKLSAAHGGRRNKALSDHLSKLGHDGIIARGPDKRIMEMVNLTAPKDVKRALPPEPGLAKSVERFQNLEVNDPPPNPQYVPGPNPQGFEDTSRIQNLEVKDTNPPQPAAAPPEPGVRRIHNPYANSKATESTAKLYSSNRKMSERKAFDYSHVLPEERRNQGYRLTIYHHSSADALAELTRHGKRVGSMSFSPIQQRVINSPYDNGEGSWGQLSHMQEAWQEHAYNADKQVHHFSDTSVGSTPFLDTLPLPEGSGQIEVDRKKVPAPAPGEETGVRAQNLEIQEPAVDNAPLPKVLPSDQAGQYGSDALGPASARPSASNWDYSHHLTPEQRARGWRIIARQLGADNFTQMHAYRDGVSFGNLWAYPSEAARGGTWNGGGPQGARPLITNLMSAMKQHGKLFHQGELQRLMNPEPSRASLLELSEPSFGALTQYVIDLLKEEQDAAPTAIKRVRKAKVAPPAPAPEPAPDLVGLHNLSAENLAHAHELGGLVAPSLAITHKDKPLEGFGDISLVASHDLIDPAKVPVFDADVYSPRHPRAKYALDDAKVKDFKKWIKPHAAAVAASFGSVEEEINREGDQGAANHYKNRQALGHAFLEEKGIHVPVPTKGKHFPWTSMPAMREFVKTHEACGKTAGCYAYPDNEHYPDFQQAVHKAIAQYVPEHIKELNAVDPGSWDDRDAAQITDDLTRRIYRVPHSRVIQDVLNPDDTEPDPYAYGTKIIAEADKHPDFNAWVDEKVKGLSGKRYLSKWLERRDGDRVEQRRPYTAENVLAEMTRIIRQGEKFNYGLGSTRAQGARQFSNLADMQSSRRKIVSSEEMKNAKEENGKRFDELSDQMKRYSTYQNAHESLQEAIADSYNKGKSVHRALKDSGFVGVPPELVAKFQAFAKQLIDTPTEYFEAKPQRIVGINEFHGAAVPHDSPQSVYDILKHHGVQHVVPYNKDVPGARAAAIAQIAHPKNLFLGEMPMTKAEDDEIDRLLLHPNTAERSMALKYPGVGSKHLVRAFDDIDPSIQAAALAHPALDHHALMALMQHPDRLALQLQALDHDDVGADHLRALYAVHGKRSVPDRAVVVRAIAHHPALDEHLISQMLVDGNGHEAIDNLHTAPADLAQVLADPASPKPLVRRALVHPNLDPHLARAAWTNGDLDTKTTIAAGPHMPEDLAQDAMNNGQFPGHDHEAVLRHAIVTGPKASDRHKATAARDRNLIVRAAASDPFAKAATAWVQEAVLAKAIHQPDYEHIVNATSAHGKTLVDHTPDLEAQPPAHSLDSTVYQQEVLNNPKVVKHKATLFSKRGISPKVTYPIRSNHPTHGGRTFLTKPYHEKPDMRLESWCSTPQAGWADMSTQALFHAAGIGHLHGRVHVVEHNMGPGHEKEPALVTRVDRGWTPAWKVPKTAKPSESTKLDVRKVAVMDFLSNNLDRHGNNLSYKEDPDSSIIAYDHGRNFQYLNTWDKKHLNQIKGSDRITDSFAPYVEKTALQGFDKLIDNKYVRDAHGIYHDPGHAPYEQTLRNYEPVFKWWGEVAPKVKAAFHGRLNSIKDPEVRAHLARNFDARAQWMDDRAHYGLNHFGHTWYNDPVDIFRPGETTHAERIGKKSK